MDKIEELKKLKKLLDENIINEEEFLREKTKLLEYNNSKDNFEIEDYEKKLENELKLLKEKQEFEKEEKTIKEQTKEKKKENLKKENLKKEKNKIHIPKKQIIKILKIIKEIIVWIFSFLCFVTAFSIFIAYKKSALELVIGFTFVLLGAVISPEINRRMKKNTKFSKYFKVRKWIIIYLVLILFMMIASVGNQMS